MHWKFENSPPSLCELNLSPIFPNPQGPLQPLIYALRKVKGKLMLVRYKIPGMGRNMGQQSVSYVTTKQHIEILSRELNHSQTPIHILATILAQITQLSRYLCRQ